MKTHRTDDPLVSFLYILLRDHLPSGAVEGIMMKYIECNSGTSSLLSNGYTAEHAEDSRGT